MSGLATRMMLGATAALCSAMLATAPSARAQEASQACRESALPEGVRAAIASQYSEWRVQTAADLQAEYQKQWMAKRPADCPGIATGEFAGKSAVSYAVLLIPREKGKRGYRLVVFDPVAKGAFSAIVLEQSDAYIPTGSGIYRIDPGLQFNEEKFSTFKLKADGLYLETLDQGGYIYYRKHGRYLRVLESD
jgi:hypothetical protein